MFIPFHRRLANPSAFHRRGALGLVAAAFLAAGLPSASATLLFSDTFSYPDGSLTTNSAGAWITTSGTAEQMEVINGSAQITRTQSEDVARQLGEAFTSGVIYYSALITMTEIPLVNTFGSYLMHLSDTDSNTSTDFFARLYVNRVANTDQYVFGVRNRSLQESPSDYPTVFDTAQPLDLNTQVAVVVKFDFATLQSTLWVNPVTETSASVTDTFAVSFAGADQALSRFAMRQASGMGSMLVDEVRVGTAFQDVLLVAVPEPGTIALLLLALFSFLVAFRRRPNRTGDCLPCPFAISGTPPASTVATR